MKTMPRQRFTLRELCLMTFLALFGMLFKPLVSPAFNLITDFVRVPGGSMTAGFSLLFLVFAAARIRKPGTALLMGLVQAAMSRAWASPPRRGFWCSSPIPCPAPPST